MRLTVAPRRRTGWRPRLTVRWPSRPNMTPPDTCTLLLHSSTVQCLTSPIEMRTQHRVAKDFLQQSSEVNVVTVDVTVEHLFSPKPAVKPTAVAKTPLQRDRCRPE